MCYTQIVVPSVRQCLPVAIIISPNGFVFFVTFCKVLCTENYWYWIRFV